MKKLKVLMLALCMLLSSTIFFACGGEENINVENIAFYCNGIGVSEIEIPEGGSQEIEVKYYPENATNVEFDILPYNESLLNITQSKDDPCLFTVTASDNLDKEETIKIAVAVKSDSTIQAQCNVKLLKDYEILTTPADVTFNEKLNKLEWSAVTIDTLESYTVNINGTEYVTYTNSIDYSLINIFDTEVVVRVKANGRFDFYDSEYSEDYTFTKLSAVEELSHKDSKITWKVNDLASSYVLNLNNQTIDINQPAVEGYITYSLEDKLIDAGVYYISIQALSSEELIFSSEFSKQIEVTRLGVPKNYALKNNTLTWGTVIGANKYQLKLDNKIIDEEFVADASSIKTYSYNLTEDLINSLETGNYSFSIQAIGDGVKTLDGAISYYEEIEKLNAPVIAVKEKVIEIADGMFETKNVVEWSQNNAIKSYLLCVSHNGKEEQINLTDTYFDLNSTYESGDYKLKVKIIGDGENTLSSSYSSEVQVYKLSKVNTATFGYDATTGDLTFTTNYATSYDIVIDGEVYSANFEDITAEGFDNNKKATINLNDKITEAGRFDVKVRVQYRDYVKGNNNIDGYIDSEYSNAYYLTKLASPKFSVKNGIVNWSSVSNTSSYELDILTLNQENEIERYKTLSSEEIGKTTSYDFVANAEELGLDTNVVYYLRIKAYGTNNASITSEQSEDFKICLLKAPEVYINDGKLDIKTVENALSYEYMVKSGTTTQTLSQEEYNNGVDSFRNKYSGKEIIVTAKAIGNKTTAYDINYLSSKPSAEKAVYQLPVISGMQINNGILEFNSVMKEDVKYNLSFAYLDKTIDVEYNTSISEEELGTSKNTYALQAFISNYSDEIISGNINYSVKIKALTDNLNLLDNNYSSVVNFTKLQTPTMGITNYEVMVQHLVYNAIDENNLSGMLMWNKIANADGYTLEVYDMQDNYIETINVPQTSKDICLYRYNNTTENTSFKFVVKANGNGTNIITSEQSYCFAKQYVAPKVFVENGIINLDVGSLNKTDTVFIFEIGRTKYLPYDFSDLDFTNLYLSDVLNKLNISNELAFPDDKASGVYDIKIYAIPLNIQTSNNLISSTYVLEDVTKLYSSLTTYMEDGKFYFSKVENAVEYALFINEELIENFVYEACTEENKNGLFVYDFAANYNETAGDYNIQIMALTDVENYVHSSLTNEVSTTVLPISNVYIKDGILTYDKVDNAEKYNIRVYDSNSNEIVNQDVETNVLTFDFNEEFPAGEYTFEITAIGNEVTYITNKNFASRTVVKLITPENIHIHNGMLRWDNTLTASDSSYYQIITTGVTETSKNIGKEIADSYAYYELDNNFKFGKYNSIKLQAMGASEYINSDISTPMQINGSYEVKKLQTPQLRVNKGVLEWSCTDNSIVSYYELVVGNNTNNVYNIGNCLTIDLANGVTTYTVNESGVLVKNAELLTFSGNSPVYVKAIGTLDSSRDNTNYLNSDKSNSINVNILNNVNNIKLINGLLTWSNPTPNDNLYLVYNSNNANQTKEQEVNIKGQTSYDNFEYFAGNQYIVYFINKGDSTGSVSSKATNNIKLSKLPTPADLETQLLDNGSVRITAETKENVSSYRFLLDDATILSDNTQNYIDIKIESRNRIENGNKITYNVLVVSGKEYPIKNIYSISVIYVGDTKDVDFTTTQTYYINSNESNSIKGTIPSSPVLNVQTALDMQGAQFNTGKIYWDYVTFSDGDTVETVTQYRVKAYYSKNKIEEVNGQYILTRDGQDSVVITENTNADDYSELTSTITLIDKNSYNVGKAGYYVVFVQSYVATGAAYSPASSCTLFYNVYENGDGLTAETAYEISTVQQFINMTYNLDGVHYKLIKSLTFTNEYNAIGSLETPFNSHLEGSEFTVTISSIKDNVYNGLFGYLGEDAIIENLNLNITMLTGYYSGGIAGFNLGTISNCVVNGMIGTSYVAPNSEIYNGGIAGYNGGYIVNCKNNAELNPNYTSGKVIYIGGIVGYNSTNAIIENCENLATIGSHEDNYKTAAYSGGIAGINYAGKIIACANKANVYALSIGEVGAYAGGIVGLNYDNGYVMNCYNNGSIYAKGDVTSNVTAYAGGIVAYNRGKIAYCLTFRANESDTLEISSYAREISFAYAGTIAGYNMISKAVANVVVDSTITLIKKQQTADNTNATLVGGGYSATNTFTNGVVNLNTINSQSIIDDYNFNNEYESGKLYFEIKNNKLALYWE